MTLTRRHAIGLLAAAIAGTPALAQSKPSVFSTDAGAINGYDPVAYFTEEKPVKGDAAFSADHDGATFYFSSAENLETFNADPAKYAPQYGGYCAWAVSKGYTAKTDPDAFSIFDGKLYLNYNKAVRVRWSIDKAGNVAAADANWPSVLN